MTPPLVQLYCKRLTRVNVEAFVAAGPDHVGWQVNVAKLDGAALDASIDEATAIALRLREAGVRSVFLVHPSTDPARVLPVLARVRPDVFLASAERTPAALGSVRASGLVGAVMVPVGIPRDPPSMPDYDPIVEMDRYAGVADWYTTDTITAADTPERFGCSGRTSDWDLLVDLVSRSPRPVVAAGGLGPGNVAPLWSRCRPAGFDAHTAVCADGEPDEAKAREFVRAVRSLDPNGPSPTATPAGLP